MGVVCGSLCVVCVAVFCSTDCVFIAFHTLWLIGSHFSQNGHGTNDWVILYQTQTHLSEDSLTFEIVSMFTSVLVIFLKNVLCGSREMTFPWVCLLLGFFDLLHRNVLEHAFKS